MSDIFMSACPYTRGAVYFWDWNIDKQARCIKIASTDKKLTENIRRFFIGLLTCPLRGLIFLVKN